MKNYHMPLSGGNLAAGEYYETYIERKIRQLSREQRISIAHARAALEANGMLKEARDE